VQGAVGIDGTETVGCHQRRGVAVVGAGKERKH
jgi:hypothetical protein